MKSKIGKQVEIKRWKTNLLKNIIINIPKPKNCNYKYDCIYVNVEMDVELRTDTVKYTYALIAINENRVILSYLISNTTKTRNNYKHNNT